MTLTIVGLVVAVSAQYAEASRQRAEEVQSKKDFNEQKEKNGKILKELEDQRDVTARTEREFREKLQTVLVQLNAAKLEDSKRITEEKIRVIEKDFTEWALAFEKNKPKIKGELDKLKSDFEQGLTKAQIDVAKKEIMFSEQSYPIISFTVRYIQKMVGAYGKQYGKDIAIDPVELPQNFYEKPTAFTIRFPNKATWKFVVSAGRPMADYNGPNLQITFTDSNARSFGRCNLQTYPSRSKYRISFRTPFPSPRVSEAEQELELADYESHIRSAFQMMIETQLVKAAD